MRKHTAKLRYKEAFLTTVFTFGGIYITFIIMSFIDGGNAVDNLFQYESSIGGLYVNLFAMISVSYSKFANEEFVHKVVYWLCLISFVVIITIYSQARCMTENTISLVVRWLEHPILSVVLQLIFVILIFLISMQKEYIVRITYRKKGK